MKPGYSVEAQNDLLKTANNNQESEPSDSINSKEEWMDKQDVLQFLHISERTLQKWRSQNLLPYSRIGRKIFYKKSDLIALLEKNRKK